MSEHMSILLDKLKKLGTGDMDGPSVMLLESPEPTQELLALLASEFAPKSAENVRIRFRLLNVADLLRHRDIFEWLRSGEGVYMVILIMD